MENNNYYSRNRNAILEYNINRYNEIIKPIEKIRCTCGLIITFGAIKKHLSSKRHTFYNKLNN